MHSTNGEFAEFEKDEKSRIRIGLEQYRGELGLDIRTYRIDPQGDWVPTAAGIRLPTDRLSDLVRGLAKVAGILHGDRHV